MCVIVKDFLIRELAQEANSGPCHAFVWDESTKDEKIIFWFYGRVKRKATCLHWRGNIDRFTSIVFTNALCYYWRVCNEVIDTHGANLVPCTQFCDEER